MKPIQSVDSAKPNDHARQGSTLLIVVALLGMLAFLGLVFYTFAKQERINSENYSAATKITKAPAIEPDSLFDYALMQLIMGPSDDNRQSILWGGRHSLLANMFGRDGVPWNGEGVNLIQDPYSASPPPNTYPGQPRVDMNYNGAYSDTNDNQGLLAFVDSPAANPGTWSYGAGDVSWTTFVDPNNASNTYQKYFRGTGSSNPTLYIPEPDVNYNAPDVNSIFLSYDGYAVDATGVSVVGTTPFRVIIPSFFRPQYMRTAGALTPSWWMNAPANQVFRPHPGHACVDANGTSLGVARFVSSTEIDTSVTPNRPIYQSLNLRRPFTSNSFMPETTNGLPATGNLGLWSWTQPSLMPPFTTPGSQTINPLDFNLDVDTDGDGILDAILMDLGHPPIRRGDGKLVVPLFAISVRDLNGLLNLNATGNISGDPQLVNIPSGKYLGYSQKNDGSYIPDNISKSNQGLTTFETNPQRALTADPFQDTRLVSSEIGRQLALFLKQMDPSVTISQPGRSIAELANLEWLMLNIGRAQFHLGLAQTASPIQNAIINVFAGRHGESSQFRTFLVPNSMTGAFANTIYAAPHAGQSVLWSGAGPTNWSAPPAVNNPNPDDNVNATEGESLYNTRWVHPLDFRGSGQQFRRLGDITQLGDNFGADLQPGIANVDDDQNGYIDDFSEVGWVGSDDPAAATLANLYGKQPDMMRLTGTTLLWPIYSGYHSFYGSAAGGVRWGEQQTSQSYYNQLMRASRFDSLLDDPAESVIDQVLLSTKYSSASLLSNAVVNDSVFGVEELAFLHGSDSDARVAQSKSRLVELLPGNMVGSQSSPDIRKRFTVVSQERREFGAGASYVGGLRAWETYPSSSVPSPYQPPYNPNFPPALGTIPGSPDPYRPELFAFMRQNPNLFLPQPPNSATQSLKLSVNRFLYLDNSGAQPHYGFAPLPQMTSLSDVHAVDATIARQNMARDIYTMLYTLCYVHSAADGDYRGTIPPATSAAQIKEMAQFAINLVDALDTDNFITAFYYDPDLSNGWQTTAWTGPDGIGGNGDDYVVYGVERQMLTFSEATAFKVMPTANNSDSDMTIFDDTATPVGGRAYLFFELQNVTPMNVLLSSTSTTAANALTTADWRIRMTDATETTEYNILYFLTGLDTTNNLLQTDPVSGRPALPPGAYFSVSSQDGSDQFTGGKYRTSDFRASNNFDGNYQRVVPLGGAADTAGGKTVPTTMTTVDQFPTPKCNLDLVWDYGDGSPSASRFVTKNNAGTAGGFVSQVAGAASVRLQLQRRVADGGVDSANTNGVWVTVDKTSDMPGGVSDIPVNPIVPPNKSAAPPPSYGSVLSYPRLVPLDRTSVGQYNRTNPSTNSSNPTVNAVPVPIQANTFNGAKASAPTSTSTTWQLHNDRDFGSLSELLQLPICGPDELTQGRLSTSEYYVDAAGKYYPTIAAARFLRPDNPDLQQNGVVTNFGNRWYRLFNFLEVPNRLHRHQAIEGIVPTGDVTFAVHPFDAATSPGNAITFLTAGSIGSTAYTTAPNMMAEPFNLPQFFGWPRTHGLLNLNMIRHPQVLLGLIDDDQLIQDPRLVGQAFPESVSVPLTSKDEGASREWWLEFIRSRDSRVTSSAAFPLDFNTQLYIPGTANARPFRGLDIVGPLANPTAVPPGSYSDSPLEDTIFRSLSLDLYNGGGTSFNPGDYRRLFEVGTATEHLVTPAAEAGGSPLPPSVRYRLYSKLMNNTTTRSNSFAVFVSIQYYEASQISVGGSTAVRIGGRLTDTPTHRGFFVVDRTGAIEQMKVLATNVNSGTINVANPATFPVSLGSFSFQPNTDTSGVQSRTNGIRWKDLVLFRQTLN